MNIGPFELLPIELVNLIVDYGDEMSQFLLSLTCSFMYKHYKIYSGNKRFSCNCAQNGYLSILKWAHQNLKQKSFNEFNGDDCFWAAKNGHFETLLWLLDNGYNARYLCLGAAQAGQVEILKWAIENNIDCFADVFQRAAIDGQTDIVKLLIKKNCPLALHSYNYWSGQHGWPKNYRDLVERQ